MADWRELRDRGRSRLYDFAGPIHDFPLAHVVDLGDTGANAANF
jgi:hypothetical protein